MKVIFIQESKDFFSADFSIVRKEMPVGTAKFRGHLGSMEGGWDILFYNSGAELHYGSELKISEYNYRPYSIYKNGNCVGNVYQTHEKLGIFKEIVYHRMNFNDNQYESYVIALGKEGIKYPIYCGNTQIALAEMEYKVYNDLYAFQISAINEEAALIAIMFCMYQYVIVYYKAGKKPVKSVSTTMEYTRNKQELAKYYPAFKDNIIE